MKSFDYCDVSLLDGLVKDSVQETMAFYLEIPVDNMLVLSLIHILRVLRDLPEADPLPLRRAEHRQRPSGLLRQHG